MNQFQVYTAVKVTAPDEKDPAHEFDGQVGVVVGAADPVAIKFGDGDAAKVEMIAASSLRGL